jgi:hypothetical protein
MLDDFRRWVRGHLAVAFSFMVGVTVGISMLVLALFSSPRNVTANVLEFGVRITGHQDIGEDLLWLFSGVVIGASVACLAWWRDNKARAAGLEKANVANRLFADPDGLRSRTPRVNRKGAGG